MDYDTDSMSVKETKLVALSEDDATVSYNMIIDDRDDMDWKIIGKCDRILCVEKVPDFDGFRLWYVYNMTKRESLFCISNNCLFCRRKTKVDFLKEAIFA